jgi:glucose/arabinose dehydrogenase
MARMNLTTLLALAALLSPAAAQAQPTFKSSAGDLVVETVAAGLVHPWSLAFLPDGRMLVTERPGRIRIVTRDGKLSLPLANVPRVYASGQGGLFDIILDRNFANNHTIYFSYAEPFEGGARTALARAAIEGGDTPGLSDIKVIYRQFGPPSRGNHFGGRIVQANDGNLFLTNGEHFTDRDKAQTLDNDLGKIVRITPEGAAPNDNPFAGKAGARPEIWSYGHRNPQGAAIHPETGKLWETEFGPRGGDELNIPQAGANYGWPVVSWGSHYTGEDIPDPPTHPEFADAIYHWNPVISPSGITFDTGDAIPAWKGNLLIGGLSEQAIVRLTLDGEKVVDEERIPMGTRIRDVVQGPDGAVYALTDEGNGEILRLTLENSPK